MPNGNWLDWLKWGGEPTREQHLFQAYRRAGGTLSFDQWRNWQAGGAPVGAEGKPFRMSPRELYEYEFAPPPGYEAALDALKATITPPGEEGKPPTPPGPPTGRPSGVFVRFEHLDGYLIPVYRDAQGNEYKEWSEIMPEREALGVERPLGEEERRRLELAERGGEEAEEHRKWERDWARQEAEAERKAAADLLAWYREEQQMRLEAEKQQRLATLRANPASWLEYASLSGEMPAIQPWMLPLMPQQYAGSTAGQSLPGYQAGAETMAGLPGMVTPSAQYMSRLAPSARQQYYGYERARTGATPEDIAWRLWSQAPPSGMYGGLKRLRW